MSDLSDAVRGLLPFASAISNISLHLDELEKVQDHIAAAEAELDGILKEQEIIKGAVANANADLANIQNNVRDHEKAIVALQDRHHELRQKNAGDIQAETERLIAGRSIQLKDLDDQISSKQVIHGELWGKIREAKEELDRTKAELTSFVERFK